jgi:hypothetical protein
MLRRAPLRRQTRLRNRTQASLKPDRIFEDQQRARRACVARVRVRDRGQCRIGIACQGGRASGGPIDPHEIVFRSHGGSAVDPDNVILACRADHEAVHGVVGKGRWILPRWPGWPEGCPHAEKPRGVWFVTSAARQAKTLGPVSTKRGARLQWLVNVPEACKGVPSDREDVTDEGRARLEQLGAAMVAARLYVRFDEKQHWGLRTLVGIARRAEGARS